MDITVAQWLSFHYLIMEPTSHVFVTSSVQICGPIILLRR